MSRDLPPCYQLRLPNVERHPPKEGERVQVMKSLEAMRAGDDRQIVSQREAKYYDARHDDCGPSEKPLAGQFSVVRRSNHERPPEQPIQSVLHRQETE